MKRMLTIIVVELLVIWAIVFIGMWNYSDDFRNYSLDFSMKTHCFLWGGEWNYLARCDADNCWGKNKYCIAELPEMICDCWNNKCWNGTRCVKGD